VFLSRAQSLGNLARKPGKGPGENWETWSFRQIIRNSAKQLLARQKFRAFPAHSMLAPEALSPKQDTNSDAVGMVAYDINTTSRQSKLFGPVGLIAHHKPIGTRPSGALAYRRSMTRQWHRSTRSVNHPKDGSTQSVHGRAVANVYTHRSMPRIRCPETHDLQRF